MAGTPTTNYNLPTYGESDAPDLLTVYNSAINSIDSILKSIEDQITNIQAEIDTTPTANFTVSDLAASGITAEGVVVNKSVSED